MGTSSVFTFAGESRKNERKRCGGICSNCCSEINQPAKVVAKHWIDIKEIKRKGKKITPCQVSSWARVGAL